MSQRWKEGKFYQVKLFTRKGVLTARKDFKWVLSGILFQMELIFHGLNTEGEQREDLGAALPLGMSQIRALTLQLCDYVYSDRGEQCGTCKTWPGKVRRKPESAADTVQYPLITHLVGSCQCCGSRPFFSGLLLTENCHCLHPLMPTVFICPADH